MSDQTFDIWAVVELMGHRRVVGRVTEQEIAGAGFLRIDIPSDPPQTQFYAPGSVYALTPVSEEAVRVAAKRSTDPITEWELPAHIRAGIRLAAPDRSIPDGEDEDDEVAF